MSADGVVCAGTDFGALGVLGDAGIDAISISSMSSVNKQIISSVDVVVSHNRMFRHFFSVF